MAVKPKLEKLNSDILLEQETKAFNPPYLPNSSPKSKTVFLQ